MTRRAWVIGTVAFAALDYYSRSRVTFSQTARWFFRTDTRLGKAALAASLVILYFHLIEGDYSYHDTGRES